MGALPIVHYAREDQLCSIWFPYNTAIVDLVRTLPERKWDPDKRVWLIPARHEKTMLITLRASDVPVRREAYRPKADSYDKEPLGVSKIDVRRAGGDLILGFAYDKGMLGLVRKIPGRWWHPEQRYWTIPTGGLDALKAALRDRKWTGVLWDEDMNRVMSLDPDQKLGATAGGSGGKKPDEESEEDARARELVDFEHAFQATQIPDVDISDVNFRACGGRAMAHQLDFMKFAKHTLAQDPSGILVCDEQGLGKTVEAINLALYRRETEGLKHCLILCCVNSNVRNWVDEVEIHTNGQEKAYVLGQKAGRRGSFSIGSAAQKLADLKRLETQEDDFPFFIVTNIETIRMARKEDPAAQTARRRKKKKSAPRTVHPVEDQLIRLIKGGQLGMVVVDEVHRNTSARSQQGRCLWRVRRATDGTACCWLPMTGTPLVNRPSDLFLSLGLCGGHDFRNFQSFEARFCPGDGRSLTECRNLGELRVLLKKKMIRRRKEDALDLPEKTQITEYVRNTSYQTELYEDAAREIVASIDDVADAPNPLAMLLKLRQINGSPELVDRTLDPRGKDYLQHNAKMARLVELVKGILESGEKALVFSNWSAPLETVAYYLKPLSKLAVITGDVPPARRMDAKKQFQEDPDCGILLGTIGAMGVGLTLTAAQHVIFLDEPWTPADKQQAEDRAHRIGTTGTIFIHTLITEDTVDERVHNILYAKSQMASLMVDGNMEVGGKNVNFRTDPTLLKHLILGGEEREAGNG